jgi:hypothetical protein
MGGKSIKRANLKKLLKARLLRGDRRKPSFEVQEILWHHCNLQPRGKPKERGS